VTRNIPSREKRKWARLQLAIPVFVRRRDENGRDSLEFATAMNISPGGALVVVRHCQSKPSLVSLEIPTAPIGPADGWPRSSRALRAKTIWVAHLNDYHLVGLKFARPLNTNVTALPRSKWRKAGSAM